MSYLKYQKLGLLLTGLTLNGLIILPVEAQIKTVTFLPTTLTDAASNTGTFSGGFTWNPSLSTASANSVPVNDPGLTYNIFFTGTGAGAGRVDPSSFTNGNIDFASSLGAWNLSSDGFFDASGITASPSSLLTLRTIINPNFIQGFSLNTNIAGLPVELAAFDLQITPPAGDFASGNPGFFIQVDTIPFEFSENFAVLTFLITLGLGYLYRNRNSFLKDKKDNLNEQEIKEYALEMTNSNK